MREEIINLIFKIAKQKNSFGQLEEFLADLSKDDLSKTLIDCGILPEMFAHDSSEEKLWAKFSDILLAKSLSYLQIESLVLGARGNSADVFGKAKNYTIVGDAKTFRLSRTAKNQKDFKVSALDTWRNENNYAVLLAPLVQFPKKKSQIYAQAVSKNVTLLSYTHLTFLLDFHEGQDLQNLWETGNELSKNEDSEKFYSSHFYWREIDKRICQIVAQNEDKLTEYKFSEIEQSRIIGKEGINFWKNKIAEFQKLTREEAVKLLIKAEKIEAKIKTIEKAVNL